MNKKRKLIMIIVSTCIVLFALYNLSWLYLTRAKYNQFSNDMQEIMVNRTYVIQEDGYLYNVKYPDYLSFTGNLGVATDDEKYALLIWPSFYGKTEYGLQLVDEKNETHSVMINKNRQAINEEYRDLIRRNKETINILFNKAAKMWKDI